MLPSVISKDRRGKLSGWGWGIGYFGGLIALVFCLFAFIGLENFSPLISLPQDNHAHVRIVGPFTALWFFLFMMPLFLFVSDEGTPAPYNKKLVKNAVCQLIESIKEIKGHHDLFLFV